MLLIGGLFEDISRFDRLELVEVTKDEDRDAAEQSVNHGDLTQSEVQVVEHVSRDHADLVDDNTPQASEENSLLCSLLLWHGEEGRAELEAEQTMQRLAIDIGRRCTSEGGEDDV